MHRFNRGDPPVNFKKISRKYTNWDDFHEKSRDEHHAIRDALYERQQHYCAYCERVMSVFDGEHVHIEHLARQKDFPKRVFDWNNMFLSCINRKICSCGKYKDEKGGKFNVDDIIDPSKENPLDFYTFDKVGRIVPIDGATSEIKRKVEETVRIFNLNCQNLLDIRTVAFKNIDDFLLRFGGRRPTLNEVECFLNNLGDDTQCISVYYDYFDDYFKGLSENKSEINSRFRLEYEERFAPSTKCE